MLLLLRIHEESFKVQIQVRNEGAHEVINGGTLLQHACNQATGGSVSTQTPEAGQGTKSLTLWLLIPEDGSTVSHERTLHKVTGSV